MKCIKAPFVLDKEIDDRAGSKTNCQAKDVDESVQRTLSDITQRDVEIISKHDTSFSGDSEIQQ